MAFNCFEKFSKKIRKLYPLQSINKVNDNILSWKKASNLPLSENLWLVITYWNWQICRLFCCPNQSTCWNWQIKKLSFIILFWTHPELRHIRINSNLMNKKPIKCIFETLSSCPYYSSNWNLQYILWWCSVILIVKWYEPHIHKDIFPGDRLKSTSYACKNNDLDPLSIKRLEIKG